MDLRVEILPLSSSAQVQGNDVIETEALAKFRGGQLQIGRQPLRDPAIESHIAVIFPDRDHLRTDDRNDGAILDVVQKVVPESLLQVGHGPLTPWKPLLDGWR